MHGLALALDIAASVACDQRNLTKAELDSSELIQLSTRHHFALWMAAGVIYRGAELSSAGKSRATGELNPAGDFLALKAKLCAWRAAATKLSKR